MSSPIGAPEITDLSHFSVSVQPIVDDFMQSVIADPIDYPKERRKQQIARRAVAEFETACSRAETILSAYSPHITADLRATYTQAKDAFNLAAVTFNRANIRFDKRKEQFLRSSALNMSFLSPRTLRKFEMWKEEAVAASPRVVKVAEVGFLGIVFLVFLTMVVGSWVGGSERKARGNGTRLNGCVRGEFFDLRTHIGQGRAVGWELVDSGFGSLEGGMFNASNLYDEGEFCLKGASHELDKRKVMGYCDLQGKHCNDDKNAERSVDRFVDSGRKMAMKLLERGVTAVVKVLQKLDNHFLAYFKPLVVIEVAVPVDGSRIDNRGGGMEGYSKRIIGRVVLYRVSLEQIRRVRDEVRTFLVWGTGGYLMQVASSVRFLLPIGWTG